VDYKTVIAKHMRNWRCKIN